MKNMKYRKGLLFILIAAEIVLSAYLAYTKITGTKAFCLTGQGCETVQNSAYGTILGIPLGVVGIASFSALFVLYLLVYNNKLPNYLFLIATIIGAIGSLYFLSLQVFVIGAICSDCFIVDCTMLIIAGITIYDYYKTKSINRW